MLLMCLDHLRSSDIVTLGILQMGHFHVHSHGGDILFVGEFRAGSHERPGI